MLKKIKTLLTKNQNKKVTINPLLYKYIFNLEKIVLYDIGAHKGMFTNLIKNNFKIDKGILVEPIPERCKLLQDLFDSNNYFIYNKVVADKNNTIFNFNINGFDETSSILKIKENINELKGIDVSLKQNLNISSITLDKISEELNIKKIDLIKIDVQGTEDLVLLGASTTLKYTQFVWIETSFKPLYENSTIFENVYKLMYNNNFILLEVSPGYRDMNTNELLQADLLFKNKLYNDI